MAMKKLNWWENKRELQIRLSILGGLLRDNPNKILQKDGWASKRLNIIGKAITCLAAGLKYLENPARLDKLIEEDFDWYKMAMKYFE